MNRKMYVDLLKLTNNCTWIAEWHPRNNIFSWLDSRHLVTL